MNLKGQCRQSNVGVVSDFLPVGNHRDWSNIHPDLLEYIQKKLPLSATFRCRSVCRHWRSTAKTLILSSLKTSPPPMLMIYRKFSNLFTDEDYSGPDGTHLILNLAAAAPSKRNSVTLSPPPNLKHGPIGRFSGGWLVGVETRHWNDREGDGRIVMFNPSSYGTSTYLRLPHIKYPLSEVLNRRPTCYDQVVFWGNPILGSNNYGMVMIKVGYRLLPTFPTRLYHAKAGDTEFSEIQRPAEQIEAYKFICDIICIKDIVYGVSKTGYIEAWDCTSASPPVNIFSFQPEMPRRDSSLLVVRVYLVEYQGDFLFVSHFAEHGGNEVLRWFFRVYKLDLDLKRWVAVESLGDMVLILLCRNQTMSLSTKEYPNYKKNSIYYETDTNIHIFNLEDGSLKNA